MNTIKLSQNEFSGTYSVNDITLDFYHRNSLSNPIYNDWYIADEENIFSYSKKADLKILFNIDKTYSITGSFKMFSNYDLNDYSNFIFKNTSFEVDNSINIKGNYEVYSDTIYYGESLKGLIILDPGLQIKAYNDFSRNSYLEDYRKVWKVVELNGNFMKIINSDSDFYHRYRANQTINLEVTKD